MKLEHEMPGPYGTGCEPDIRTLSSQYTRRQEKEPYAHPSLSLAGLADLVHGFFDSLGGCSQGIYAQLNASEHVGDSPARVAENRRRITQALDWPAARLVTARQVHGIRVVTVRFGDKIPPCDALVTQEPGLLLGVTIADCAPILMCDSRAHIIAACHAGWRGACAGVIESTLEHMSQMGAALNHIHAVIGPTIAAESYPVGQGVLSRILHHGTQDQDLFSCVDDGDKSSAQDKRWYFDLPKYVLRRLQRSGVGHVERIHIDTATHDDFFSSRQQQKAHGRGVPGGRQIAVIGWRR